MTRQPEHIYLELLVLRCQAGDVGAFEELVGHWQPRLWRHALRLTGRHDAAAEALQETWLAIVRGIRTLDDPARFGSWARRIVTHKAADRIRRQQRRRNLAREVARLSAADPDELGEHAEHGEHGEHGEQDEITRLRGAMQRLTPDSRAILALRYLDELSVAQIAVILDIPPGTAKSRLHHARNQLEHVLERVTP